MEERLKKIEQYLGGHQFQIDVYEALSRELEAGKPLSIGKRTTKDYSAGFALFSVSKGIGFPAMTEVQRDLIEFPAPGMVIYNINQGLLNQWTGTEWQNIGFALVTTVQRDALTPYFGMTVFNTDTFTLDFYNGIQWISLNGSTPPSYTTTERDALVLVPTGMIIFNSTTSKLNFYTGSVWEEITSV